MEPARYARNARGNWIISDDWKKWKDAKKVTKPKTIKNNIVTEETHAYKWKEVALQLDTGRGILFCCCMSGQGEQFRGCGAVAIRSSKASKLSEVIPPRFA